MNFITRIRNACSIRGLPYILRSGLVHASGLCRTIAGVVQECSGLDPLPAKAIRKQARRHPERSVKPSRRMFEPGMDLLRTNHGLTPGK
jgi:hypothetical protein